MESFFFSWIGILHAASRGGQLGLCTGRVFSILTGEQIMAVDAQVLDELRRKRILTPASELDRPLERVPSGLAGLDRIAGGGLENDPIFPTGNL